MNTAVFIARLRSWRAPLAVLLGLGALAGLLAESIGPRPLPAGARAPHVQAAWALRRAGNAQVRVEGAAGTGVGVSLDADGDVLAGAWVLGVAKTVTVKRADGMRYQARVHGVDARTGLALLVAGGSGAGPGGGTLDSVEPLQPGQQVYTLGGGGAVHARAGAVLDARGGEAGSPAVPAVLTDIRTCPEDAGGVLADAAGRVVGVLLARAHCAAAQALPLSAARHLAAQLKAGGRAQRGWIGLEVEDAVGGVQVRRVAADSPAAHAGLRAGDRVVNLDGQPMLRASELAPRIAESPPGHDAALTVLRNGHRLGVTVIVAAEPGR